VTTYGVPESQRSDNVLNVAGLSTLYEIASLTFDDPEVDFSLEAREKAIRLFGLRRFALLRGAPGERELLSGFGLGGLEEGELETLEGTANRAVYQLGPSGTLGLLIFERGRVPSAREKRLCDIYVRRIEEALERARNDEARLAAEAEARAVAHRMWLVFDSMSEGIAIADLEGHVLQTNRAFTDMFGIEDIAAFVGESVYSLAVPADRATAGECHAEALREGMSGSYSLEMMRADGSTFPARMSVSLVRDRGGESVGLTAAIEDLTAVRRVEELQESQSQLRELADHLQQAREEERTGIARELHDELGQALTALKMDLGWLRQRVGSDDASFMSKVEGMTKLIDNTSDTVRKISSELRPGILDDLGLVVAMGWQADEFERRKGIPCAFVSDADDLQLDPRLATALFRVFQECLTNVARHAEASSVVSELIVQEGVLRLSVSDDGKGITDSQAADPLALGLVGMRERLQRWHGRITISGVSGRGTAVVVVVPLR